MSFMTRRAWAMLAPTAAVLLAAIFLLTQNGEAPSESPSPPGSDDQANGAGDQVKAPVKPKHWHGVIDIYDDRVKPPKPSAKPARPAVAKASKAAAPLDLDAEFKQILQKPPASLEQTLTITSHSPAISAVVLSADGSRAVSCGSDGVCRCLDPRTGAELSRYERKLDGKWFCAAITPDGKYGLVGGEFKTVHVWNTATGKHIWSPSEPEETIRQIDVTADSQQFGFRTDTSIYQYPILGTEGASVTVDRSEFLNFAMHPTANHPLAAFREAPNIYNLYLPTAKTPASSQAVKTADLSKTLVAGLNASEHFMAVQMLGPVMIAAVNQDDGSTIWWRRYTRLRNQVTLRITNDEEFLIGLDSDGFIEFRRLNNSATAITYDTGARFRAAHAISGDGRTLAIGHRSGPTSGQIAVYRLSDFPIARSLRFEQLLDRCFYDDDFDQLEAIAARLQADPVKYFPWNSRRTKFGAMIKHLAAPSPSLRVHDRQRDAGIQKWLKAKPDSVTAKLVQAEWHINAGWMARGGGFANTVTEQGWRDFAENIEQAARLIVPIVDGKQPPPEVYPLLFVVAKSQSWTRKLISPYVDRLLKTAPTLSDAHRCLAEMFLRRWGGEFGESEAYARFVAEKVGGAAGDAEYAKIALCLRRYFRANDFVPSTKFDMERVHRGVSHITETMPEDSDILSEGFLLAWQQENTKVASWYLDKLEPYDTQWPTGAWKDRRNYASAKTWALKSLTPSLVYAKDISAAQRVVSTGGSVSVELVDGDNSIKNCKRVEELPKEPFKLRTVRYARYIPDETPDFSFLSGLKSLTHITLPPDKSTDATMATLTNLPGLTYFTVRGCPGVTDAALRDVARFPALTHLTLDGASVTDSGLASLKNLPALRGLTLQNAKITDAGLDHLKSLPKLSSVSLSQPGVTDEGVATIAQISTISFVDLALPDATGKCLQDIVKLPLLKTLHLARINMTEADLAELRSAEHLTALWLRGIPLSDVGLEHLGRLQGLRNLVLLHCDGVTPEQAKKLQAALPECRINGVNSEQRSSTPNTPEQRPSTSTVPETRPAAPKTPEQRPSTSTVPETRPTTAKIPESPAPADPAYAKNRSAAQRVIKAGGGVIVRSFNNGNSSAKYCRRVEELPQVPFELESVDYFRSVPNGVSDFSFLSGLKSLWSIRLPNEKSTDATMAALTKLPKLRNLVVLRAPGFTDAALRDLRRFPELASLILDRASVTDSGLASLKDLPVLQVLTLRNTKITDAGLAHLKSLPKLKILILAQPGVTDEGVATIAQISTLHSVHLTLPDATGKCLQHVVKLPRLETLSLTEIDMTEADLAALLGAKHLATLSLGGIPISDVGLEHLSRLQGLRYLTFDPRSGVTVEQAKKLQAALPKCRISGAKSEQRSSTSTIPESPAPAPVDYARHLSAAQRVIKTGGSVSVRLVNGNSSTKYCKRAEELPKEPFQLKTVGYLDYKPDETPDFSFLSGLESLWSIHLPKEKSTDATMATLTNLPALKGLSVQRCPGVTDAALQEIRRFPALTSLFLDGASVTDSGLANLKHLRELRTLSLRNMKITDAGLAHLKSLPKLWELHLAQPHITDDGVATIAQIPTLSFVELTLPDATRKCLQHVAKLPRLSNLSLSEIDMTEADLAALRGAEHLAFLAPGGIPIGDVGLAHLSRLQGLRHLSFNVRSGVTAEQAKKLQAALPKCKIYGVKGYKSPK